MTALGSIDLRDFCNCPDPCPACCDITTDCCGDTVPANLSADVQAGANPVVTIPLQYDGSNWEGSGELDCGTGTQTIYLRLTCLPAGTFQLSVSCEADFANKTDTAPSASACNPLDLTFTTNTPASGCPACGSTAITVDVTE